MSTAAFKEELNKYTAELANAIGVNAKNTLDSAWEILQLTIVNMVQFIETHAPTDEPFVGSDKKIAAMEAMSEFWEVLYVTIEIPYLPRSIRKILHPYTRKLFLMFISGSIDATVATLTQLTNFKKGDK